MDECSDTHFTKICMMGRRSLTNLFGVNVLASTGKHKEREKSQR
jgi:hypothetical protein